MAPNSPRSQRPSEIRIDLQCLTANIRVLQDSIGRRSTLAAVVKADGYGIGAQQLILHLQSVGVRHFFVFDPTQAAEAIPALRADSEIIVLRPFSAGPTSSSLQSLIGDNRVTWTAHSSHEVELLQALATSRATQLPIHLEIDTGMNRGGCDPGDLAHALNCISRSRHLDLKGVSSHLATSDSDLEVATEQMRMFDHALKSIDRDVTTHIFNSHAALRIGEHPHSMVRVGLAMFGYFAGPDDCTSTARSQLQPAIQWTSRICQVRTVKRGGWIGYGRTYQAGTDMRVGVVPVGYADGFPARSPEPLGFEVGVRSEGGEWRMSSVIGLVNMDQLLIDLTDSPHAAEGDEVAVYGNDPRLPNFPVEVARRAGTIVYDLLCRLGPRIERRWT